jgi:hypothetical protein
VPAVSGPQEAAAAWRLLVQLSGRRVLNKHARAELGAAAAELAKVRQLQGADRGWSS